MSSETHAQTWVEAQLQATCPVPGNFYVARFIEPDVSLSLFPSLPGATNG